MQLDLYYIRQKVLKYIYLLCNPLQNVIRLPYKIMKSGQTIQCLAASYMVLGVLFN